MVRWAGRIATLNYWAKRVLRRPHTDAERLAWATRLTERVRQEAIVYSTEHGHPWHALCKRDPTGKVPGARRYLGEWFVLVRIPGVLAENTPAERSLRSAGVQRKIGDGVRSRDGTQTRMVLANLFGTWDARGLNPFDECGALLSQ